MSKKDGVERLPIRFDPEFYKSLKRKALDDNTSLQDVGVSLFTRWLRSHDSGTPKDNLDGTGLEGALSEAYKELLKNPVKKRSFEQLADVLQYCAKEEITVVTEALRVFSGYANAAKQKQASKDATRKRGRA
jgi:hypothetical protein